MDLPPYAAQEVQIVQERLAECGLNAGGYTVTYQDYLQSVEVLIDDDAEAKPAHFPCIKEAADVGLAIVSFTNREAMSAYMVGHFAGVFRRAKASFVSNDICGFTESLFTDAFAHLKWELVKCLKHLPCARDADFQHKAPP